MKIAAIYTRVSSDEQVKGCSLDVQEKEIIKYCENNGYKHSKEHIYREEGYSGFLSERPQLQRLMDGAREKRFDTVIVLKTDRYARNLQLLLNMVGELKDYGVGFISVKENIDNQTSNGKTLMQVFGWVAEMERDMIRDRTLMGQLEAKKKHHWAGSAPYGYNLNKETKKLVINEDEARWVRKMYGWVINEHLSLYKIQKRLMALKVPTKVDNLISQSEKLNKSDEDKKKTKRGKKTNGKYFWNTRTIHRVLENEVYCGRFTYRKYKKVGCMKNDDNLRPREDWIAINTPRIITDEQYEAVQSQLKKNKQYATRKAKHLYLFGGMIYCKKCGYKFGGYNHCHSTSKASIRYKCYGSYPHFKQTTCDSNSITEKLIEPPIWDKIKDVISNPDIVIEYLEKMRTKKIGSAQVESRTKELEILITSSKEKSKKLLDLYLEEQIIKDVYYKKKEELENEIQEMTKELNRLKELQIVNSNKEQIKSDLTEMFGQYTRNLKNIKPEQRREIYKRVIDKMYISGQDIEVFCTLPFLGGKQRMDRDL